MIKPLFLLDLDDTVLQTARKMAPDQPRQVAALDKHGQPLSFTSNNQRAFLDWLLASADVVPVTARSVDACKRVQIPFSQGAICAHGAVLLNAGGEVDATWQKYMINVLGGYQSDIQYICQQMASIGIDLGVSLRTWVVEEQGLSTYALAKHSDRHDEVLAFVEGRLGQRVDLSAFYIHRNGNNLAVLPKVLHKRFAVEEWLRRDRDRHGERPVLGFGDSLSDIGFLQLCDWWATPRQGQLANAVYRMMQDTD
jgi:hydroxymethylpyrimidine pyrophosphatase-like HAD family hydrolase